MEERGRGSCTSGARGKKSTAVGPQISFNHSGSKIKMEVQGTTQSELRGKW